MASATTYLPLMLWTDDNQNVIINWLLRITLETNTAKFPGTAIELDIFWSVHRSDVGIGTGTAEMIELLNNKINMNWLDSQPVAGSDLILLSCRKFPSSELRPSLSVNSIAANTSITADGLAAWIHVELNGSNWKFVVANAKLHFQRVVARLGKLLLLLEIVDGAGNSTPLKTRKLCHGIQ